MLPFPVDELERRPWTLWRYREALPEPLASDPRWEDRVSLGEGGTPLVRLDPEGSTWLKLEQLNPTGSFKDRGAAVLIATALARGVERVVVDSSGNAGAAAAAYCARAGLACEVYVPASVRPEKLAQVRVHGAKVVAVEGTRADVAAAAERAVAETGAFHASHVHQPAFHAGVATLAFELWEQCHQLGRSLPDSIVLPVGNGSLLLGVAAGFARLVDAGLIADRPRLLGVQAETCAPVAAAWTATTAPTTPTAPTGPTAPTAAGATVAGGAAAAPGPAGATGATGARGAAGSTAATGPTVGGSTVAEGIAIAHPARLPDMVAALRAGQDDVVTVTDDQIVAAQGDLAARGLWVEPTGAVAYAGWRRLTPDRGSAVVLLTGHGFKSPTPSGGPPPDSPGGGRRPSPGA